MFFLKVITLYHHDHAELVKFQKLSNLQLFSNNANYLQMSRTLMLMHIYCIRSKIKDHGWEFAPNLVVMCKKTSIWHFYVLFLDLEV